MLKGHTRIELTDVNTGKVEVHEDDNMFTDAIYKTLNNGWTALVGGVSTLKDWHLPLSQKMLGGIALFEDSITEDAAITHFPKGNHVVATAGTIASDGATKNWGGRNLLESEAYDPETKSVKHVWDFGTAEANGRISAVGLMDGRQADYYGQSAWNKLYSRGVNVTSYFSDFGLHIAEFKGDTLVAMTNGKGTVTIKKVKFNFDTVSLNNTLGTTEVISEKTVALPNSEVEYTCTFWFDGDDGYWYGFIHCSGSNFSSPYQYAAEDCYRASRYLQVIRIDKETYGMEYHNIDTGTYYTFPKVAHPIITDNYIVLPVSTSEYWKEPSSGSAYISRVVLNCVGVISKSDWTWSVKELKDTDENAYSMFTTTNKSAMGAQFFGCWSNLKLKNGLYQMNDIIFDDNVVVQEQVKPYISTYTYAPMKSADETTSWRCSLNYQYGSISYISSDRYRRGQCFFMLPNEEKEIILIGGYGHNSSFNGGSAGTTWNVYAVPYDGQKLMTINNLPEPVTKTASQTMKITYTITDTD